MSREAEEHYNNLKESGELKFILPKAKGEWDLDKSLFLSMYEENLKFIKDFENGDLDLDINEGLIDDADYD